MTNHIPTEPSQFILDKLKKYRVDTKAGRIYNPKGEEVGSVGPYGYVVITFWDERKKPKVTKRSHIVYWAYHGIWPTSQIDHDNRIRTDDRIDNLKTATEREQQQNTSRSDRLLPPGVYENGFKSKTNPYVVQYWHNGKLNYLGCFPNPETASQAYQKKMGELT